MEKKLSYSINGNFVVNGKIENCLITALFGATEESAQKALEKVLANPPANCVGNIHIEKTEKTMWWNW